MITTDTDTANSGGKKRRKAAAPPSTTRSRPRRRTGKAGPQPAPESPVPGARLQPDLSAINPSEPIAGSAAFDAAPEGTTGADTPSLTTFSDSTLGDVDAPGLIGYAVEAIEAGMPGLEAISDSTSGVAGNGERSDHGDLPAEENASTGGTRTAQTRRGGGTPGYSEKVLAAARNRLANDERAPISPAQLSEMLALLHDPRVDRSLVISAFSYLKRGMSMRHARTVIRQLRDSRPPVLA